MTKTAQNKSAARESTGSVKGLFLSKGFGFIRPSDNGMDLFFHCNDLLPPLEFDERLRELAVRFQIRQTSRGPRAANVQPLD